MKKLFMLVMALCLVACNAGAQLQRPKLVVGLVVDQMRWDYLYYYNQYGSNGLRRLLSEGYSCNNMLLNYVPTVTAVGHSTIFSGALPAVSGIAGNYFYINDKQVYCCADNSVQSVGSNSSEGQMSPHRFMVNTIGDELKTATDFKSKVVGVALKDRAAILPAGHAADGAYWWDTSAGHFVTSTFYMKQLPQWVVDFNKANQQKPGTDVKTSVKGVDLTFAMAEAAVNAEQLGQHDVTDMLTVSVSSTDAIGHKFGTRGQQNHDVYMQLDKDLAEFLSFLDSKVGKGNYLLFLTADHGSAHNYNYMLQHHIPAGAFTYNETVKQVNQYLTQKVGIAPVMGEDNYQLYINDSTVLASGHTMDEVKTLIVNYLQSDPQFQYVVDNDKVALATMPDRIKQMITNGYYRGRSGEITLVTRPQYFGAENSPKYTGTQHGQWNPYDAHIPFILMGWHVNHGYTNMPVHMTDIAPTVCAMLHIQMPNGCIGDAITAVTDQVQ